MKSFKKKVRLETMQILESAGLFKNDILTKKEIVHLPPPVKKWLEVSGAIGRKKASTVWLKQKFLMKLKPQQKKWYHANAQQLFYTENPSFVWAVRLKIMPLLYVIGRDKYINGKGEMQMKLNGIFNLGKETGKKMDEGTLQRYLGEIIWFPSAAVSSYIKWEAVDDFTTKATMNYQGTTGSGTFYFNKDGYLDKFIALRYMGNAQDAKRCEWVITANEHAQWNGVTIPSKLKATWLLETGPWTWCNIEITDIRYNVKGKSLSLIN